jgi:6-phosphogluconolactonase (cycloisomerase 2 family)
VKRFYLGHPRLVPLFTISFIALSYISGFCLNHNSDVLRRAYDSVPAIAAPASVTIDPVGHFAFVANMNSDDVTSYGIDPATGSLRAIAPTAKQ